ncbi:hypothetical protein BD626DRAFT_466674 [Schizophyllum amplum]|uniref:Uncharacterized protein n=1 Tax=Schizophyllum amplum TaxID=97359 RepID=A0A550BUU2_9AGAR|nr:hypothetical protein BD626DRAFT_466674 [Auriculariopsis ampla]
MLPVHFSTADEDGKDVFDDHIVLWISVHPDTTKEISCRDANDEILAILAKHGIQDAAVHWFEGAIKFFCGFPPMMRVARDTDPTHWIRRALTAHLSVPIVAEAFTKFETPGTLGLFFREGKDRSGNESTRVMALTNKHLTSYDIKQDYEYSGRTGAPKQFIRNCGSRRFQQIVNEARALIANKLEDVKFFAEELAQMSAKLKLEDQALTVDEEEDLRRKREDLQRAKKDIVQLDEFLRLLNSTWSDDYQRIIGFLDWAPRVANDLDHRCYTRDLAVIALDEDKFKDNFRGNSIYLAGKYTRKQITSFFNAANPPVFQYPNDHLFRLSGCVDATGLANPCSMDEDNKACFIVAKDGQSTDLTFGRFSELEAYTCKDFVHDSWEVAVFNYNMKQGDFSGPGDSGAAIFNARGALMAILHSGMPRGAHSHVTFGTPGHYVVELIKERYPNADFECLQFDA